MSNASTQNIPNFENLVNFLFDQLADGDCPVLQQSAYEFLASAVHGCLKNLP